MMTPIIVLNNQMSNIKLRSSKPINNSDAQKQMADSSFGHRFHDLEYFEVEFFFFILLEFIIHKFEVSSQNFVENHQFVNLVVHFTMFVPIVN